MAVPTRNAIDGNCIKNRPTAVFFVPTHSIRPCYLCAKFEDMEQSIRRTDVLAQMEIRETATGKPLYFAIQFYKQNGEVVTLTRARSCGLRMNMTGNRSRGVQTG